MQLIYSYIAGDQKSGLSDLPKKEAGPTDKDDHVQEDALHDVHVVHDVPGRPFGPQMGAADEQKGTCWSCSSRFSFDMHACLLVQTYTSVPLAMQC